MVVDESMSEILDKEYYEKNLEYSECHCIKCNEKTLRVIGIESYEEYDREDKTLYQCEKCGQKAYINIEWIFTIIL